MYCLLTSPDSSYAHQMVVVAWNLFVTKRIISCERVTIWARISFTHKQSLYGFRMRYSSCSGRFNTVQRNMKVLRSVVDESFRLMQDNIHPNTKSIRLAYSEDVGMTLLKRGLYQSFRLRLIQKKPQLWNQFFAHSKEYKNLHMCE